MKQICNKKSTISSHRNTNSLPIKFSSKSDKKYYPKDKQGHHRLFDGQNPYQKNGALNRFYVSTKKKNKKKKTKKKKKKKRERERERERREKSPGSATVTNRSPS